MWWNYISAEVDPQYTIPTIHIITQQFQLFAFELRNARTVSTVRYTHIDLPQITVISIRERDDNVHRNRV